MNSKLKQKMHKGSRIKLRNCITPNQETKTYNKSTTRSHDILGKNMTMTKLVWIQKEKDTNT